MGSPLNAILNQLPEARRERIFAEADRLQAEYLTLQMLRKSKKLTQTQLADILDIRQATVARMEKRNDLMLSTLRNYVEAMGGRLVLAVEFPNQSPVVLKGFGDTEQPASHFHSEPETSYR